MSGREASGIRRVIARLFPDAGPEAAAARPPSAGANRRLAFAKPVPAAQSVAARSVLEREREQERMQRRIRRTREAYARLRRAPSAPR